MSKLFCGVAAMLAAAGLACAEEKCQTFRGVLQAYFDASVRNWVTEIHGVLDDAKMLAGGTSAIQRLTTSIDRGIGIDRDGLLLWDFGVDGSLTIEVPIGLHLRPAPGPHGFGLYRGMGKIVDGTGDFVKTTGTVVYEGPWVLWFETPGDATTARGRWNAEVTMRICKAQ
jgi:hypothetical protein